MNIFTDFTVRINFNLSIPFSEKKRLEQHIIKCAKENPYLQGISFTPYYFTLPKQSSEEYRQHIINIANSVDNIRPESKSRFINEPIKGIQFASSHTPYNIIVGIVTDFGLPTLTVEEVEALRSCMTSYETLDSKVQRPDFHIPETNWNENAYDNFIDPISLELLIDPMIASDGNTYSKETLVQIFKGNRLSPLTRELLVPIGKASWTPFYSFQGKEIGIPNLKVKQLLDTFIEGKLKTSRQKYLKYKLKYLNLKNK
jgi:hypothetical protein